MSEGLKNELIDNLRPIELPFNSNYIVFFNTNNEIELRTIIKELPNSYSSRLDSNITNIVKLSVGYYIFPLVNLINRI